MYESDSDNDDECEKDSLFCKKNCNGGKGSNGLGRIDVNNDYIYNFKLIRKYYS